VGLQQLRVTAMVLALVSACGTKPSAGPVLAEGPSGFPVDRHASRSQLSAGEVAEVLPSDPRTTRSELVRDGFVNAATKVFRAPSGDFVLSVTLRFDTTAHAGRALQHVLDDVGARGAAFDPSLHGAKTGVFRTASLPGATTFVLGGEDRAGGHALFLQGVAFTVGPRAFVVESGGSAPANTQTVEGFAVDLHRLASKES